MDVLPCALAPEGVKSYLADAIRDGGGTLVAPDEARALVWTDPTDPGRLPVLLADNPGIEWVQLPWAGITPFLDIIDDDHVWTAGQGVYAEPVAEHALALALAGMRAVGTYARRTSWSGPRGRNLLGARVTILGGGGIATELVRLLAPFDADVTVLRRSTDEPVGGARVRGPDELHGRLEEADLVVLALALTSETEGIIDADALAVMPEHAWLVNVARGAHVVTSDLVAALRADAIGGAALDVTDPEPLPDGHPLWTEQRCIITPHVGNTPEMAAPLLSRRVQENVRRFRAGEDLLGVVDPDRGY